MRSSYSRFATMILAILVVAGCATAASPAPSTTSTPTGSSVFPSASAMPSASPGPSVAPTIAPSLPPSAASATLPVHGSAEALGGAVQMAPRPDGDVYVSIPRPGGSVLALLDRTGKPHPGWPINVEDSTSCGLLLPVEDGSVRVVCNATDLPQPESDLQDVRAFAFDAAGRLLPGWPVQLRLGWPAGYVGAVVGDELVHFTEQRVALNPNSVTYEAWVTRIAVDGTTQSGARVSRVEGSCCGERWAIGPDGVAYGSVLDLGQDMSAPNSSELLAVSATGVPGGFPIAIDGMASEPSFDADGRLHVTVVKEAGGPARTLVFDTNGQAAVGDSAELGVSATDECSGIEGTCFIPAAPLVGPDGTTFVVEAQYVHTKVAGLRPSGQMMAGWPYRSEAGVQGIGVCDPGDICEGGRVATAALGPGEVVYLINRSNDDTAEGGSLVALGRDGRVRAGWPVALKRAGAAFWSVVVGPDGTAYALAIEPEPGGKSSASILAIAPDSTVGWTTTIIEP